MNDHEVALDSCEIIGRRGASFCDLNRLADHRV